MQRMQHPLHMNATSGETGSKEIPDLGKKLDQGSSSEQNPLTKNGLTLDKSTKILHAFMGLRFM